MSKYVEKLNLEELLTKSGFGGSAADVAEAQTELFSHDNTIIWEDPMYRHYALGVLKDSIALQLAENKIYTVMFEASGFDSDNLNKQSSMLEAAQTAPLLDLEGFKLFLTDAEGNLMNEPNRLPGLLHLHPEETSKTWYSSATESLSEGGQPTRNPSAVPRQELGTALMAAGYLDAFERSAKLSTHQVKKYDKCVLFSPDPKLPFMATSQFGFIASQLDVMVEEGGLYFAFEMTDQGIRPNTEKIIEMLDEANENGESVMLGASPLGIYMALAKIREDRGEDFKYKSIKNLLVIDGGGGLETGSKGALQARTIPNEAYIGLILGLFPEASIEDITSVYGTSEICFNATAQYFQEEEQIRKLFHNPGYSDVLVYDINTGDISETGEGLMVIVTAINTDNAGANFALTTDWVKVYENNPVTGDEGKTWEYIGRLSDIHPDIAKARKTGCGANYLQLVKQVDEA